MSRTALFVVAALSLVTAGHALAQGAAAAPPPPVGLVRFDGVPGDSEIFSFSWGETNSTTTSGGGGGAGKVQMSDVHFTKMADAASPKLYEFCANGRHVKEVAFSMPLSNHAKSGTTRTVTLKDVLVTSAQIGALDVPETFSLNFARIEIEEGRTVVFCWDVVGNKSC